MDDAQFSRLYDEAIAMGRAHGDAVASWTYDGNTPFEWYVATLKGLEDGDPATYDILPSSPLSGEYADAPTPATVLNDLGVSDDDDAAFDLLAAYEEGFYQYLYAAVAEACRKVVYDAHERRVLHHDPLAYTYEADHHCVDCTVARFGLDEDRDIPADAVDGEGNPVGAVAPWDEWYEIGCGPQTLACGTCGAILDEYDESGDDGDDEDGDNA